VNKFVPVVMAAGLLAAGCPQFQREKPAGQRQAPPKEITEADINRMQAEENARKLKYQEGTHAAEALAMVKAKVGEPFRVLQILVYPTHVKVQAQDPKKKENVDSYDAEDGKVGGPTPVLLIGEDNSAAGVSRAVFDPSQVAIDKISDLVQVAAQKIQLEGRDEPLVTIDRDMFEGKVEIVVSYSGTRKNGNYTTDAKGQHGKAEVN